MEIRGENYVIRYDDSTSTVSLEGILRLYGAAGYFSIEDFNKHHDVLPTNSGNSYVSIMELFEFIAKQKLSSCVLNLRGLELLNSSGINVLSKFVIKIREMNATQLTIQGSQQFLWQSKVLQNLQKLMPGLNVEFD